MKNHTYEANKYIQRPGIICQAFFMVSPCLCVCLYDKHYVQDIAQMKQHQYYWRRKKMTMRLLNYNVELLFLIYKTWLNPYRRVHSIFLDISLLVLLLTVICEKHECNQLFSFFVLFILFFQWILFSCLLRPKSIDRPSVPFVILQISLLTEEFHVQPLIIFICMI